MSNKNGNWSRIIPEYSPKCDFKSLVPVVGLTNTFYRLALRCGVYFFNLERKSIKSVIYLKLGIYQINFCLVMSHFFWSDKAGLYFKLVLGSFMTARDFPFYLEYITYVFNELYVRVNLFFLKYYKTYLHMVTITYISLD